MMPKTIMPQNSTEEKPTYSPRRVTGFLFGLWRISPRATLAMAISQVIFAILTTTIAPLFVSQLLQHIANGSATLASSVPLLIGYASVLFLGDVVTIRFTIFFANIAESKMQSTIAARSLDRLMAKSMTYHSNRISGGIVSDNTKLNSSIERFWDTLVFTAIPIFTTIIAVCTVLSFIFWQFALALAIVSIIIAAIIVKAQGWLSPRSRNVADKSSAMTAYFADVISNISAVKAFAGDTYEARQYTVKIDDWRRVLLSEMKGVLLVTGSFGAMMVVMNVIAFGAAIVATQNHLAQIGTVYLVINYTLNVVGQLWGVTNLTRSYIRIIGDAGPMIQTLDEPIELRDPEHPTSLNITRGAIEFDHVTFTHDANDDALFHDFSLAIKPGQKVGLVGVSGSGKTSLTRLLLRFSDIDSGAILIDGTAIDTVSQNDLRRAIAYVPQEPVLFHRSLRDNIAYGNPAATLEDVREAAQKANALDFIETLPDSFNTLVGERGIKLSGGQRQRIAIARAVLKNAPILVLDEATSALDSESERLIQDALEKLMKQRTSIVIAHRLSTIAKLDRIIVMDAGTIIEDGSHGELLARNRTYARLWNQQTGGFIQ